jgi:raffinose/stachyose/melibiose transport system substrate-binding protein
MVAIFRGKMAVRVLQILLVSSLAIQSLTACSAESYLNQAPAEQSVTLHIIHWSPVSRAFKEKFESQHPKINLQIESYPVDQFVKVIQNRLISGQLPDLLGAQENLFSEYIKQGVFLDLTGESFLNNYTAESLQQVRELSPLNGVFSVPTDVAWLGIWINRTIFDKYDIAIPGNYDQLFEAADKLQEHDIAPFVSGALDAWTLGQTMFSLFQLQLVEPDFYSGLKTGKTRFTDPRFIDALSKWQHDYAGHLFKQSSQLTYQQAFEIFTSQEAAMMPMGSWATEFLQTSDGHLWDLGFQLEFIPFLGNPPGVPIQIPSSAGGGMIGIHAGSAHIEEAKQLLDFLSQPDNARLLLGQGGAISPLKGIDFEQAYPSAVYLSNVVLQYPGILPFNVKLDSVVDLQLIGSLQRLIQGSDPSAEAEAMQHIQDKVNKERN